MAGRVAAFRESFAGQAGNWIIGAIGAFFGYLRHPFDSLNSMQAARRLANQQNLLCLPGSAFGPGQERYVRAAFANADSATMPEICRRLALCS